MNGEREPIDLEPYITGKRAMMNTCYKCKQKKDMTKDFIVVETQNNLRKQSPDYNAGCDELVFFSWTCQDCKDKKI
jgi:hypothetical protein